VLYESHVNDLALSKFAVENRTLTAEGMVWEGNNVVLEGRKMLGATKPSESALGTIRGDFCIDVGRNVCHGSDSVDSANKEISLWFPEGLVEWITTDDEWVHE
jgi:nucleoside-diphosphate kinase